jgi:hypothetical protein
MSKVTIKCQDTSDNLRTRILIILNDFGAKCSKLFNSRKGEFAAYCHSDKEADGIFSDECLTALKAINCTPVMPMKLKAKRSVLVKNVDDHIYNNDVDAIKKELLKHNEWLAITEIFKFPSAKLIKITCSKQEFADKCLVSGLKMFHLYVPPR